MGSDPCSNPPQWLPARRIPLSHLPGGVRDWLLDPASLTHRLKQIFGDSFEVRVLEQRRTRPRRDEARTLRIKATQRGLIREVQLVCGGRPRVFARTVIPVRTLTGSQRRLALLGNKPLGAFLFANPGMRRGSVEISRMMPGHDLFERATRGLRRKPPEIWGRRSVFFLGGKPLLVSEIFLESPGECLRRWPYSP